MHHARAHSSEAHTVSLRGEGQYFSSSLNKISFRTVLIVLFSFFTHCLCGAAIAMRLCCSCCCYLLYLGTRRRTVVWVSSLRDALMVLFFKGSREGTVTQCVCVSATLGRSTSTKCCTARDKWNVACALLRLQSNVILSACTRGPWRIHSDHNLNRNIKHNAYHILL